MNSYKLRQVVRRFAVPSSVVGYEYVQLKREELECGHVVRARDPQSTAEAMTAVLHTVNGTMPRRRCFECGKLEKEKLEHRL